MNKFGRYIVISIFLLSLSCLMIAQKGVEDGSRYGHGDDSIRCIKNLSLYREYVKHQEYTDAIHSWRIVFSECPKSTKNIYIDGVKMYKTFIDGEKDPARRDMMIDTLMLIYDRRIKYFKEKGSVLGRKGVDLMRYKRNDLDKVEEAYGYLKESVTIMKNRSSVPVIATFMTSVYTLFEKNRLTDMDVIDNYALTSDIIDYKLSKKPDDADVLKVKENVDLNFIVSGAPTCESLIAYFQAEFEERKEDTEFLRKGVTFLGTLDCEMDPYYATLAEALYNLDPSPQAAFSLAKLFVTKEQYEKASNYYKEAIEKEEDPLNKADYYYQLGVITNSKLKQPELAKNYALESISLNPNWGEPYILVGDTYVASKDCFQDEFEKTTIYWAAVDKFIKAKDVDPEVSEKANERISTYSQYFPDVETIFFYSLKEGDPYTVECWINEKTTVRPR